MWLFRLAIAESIFASSGSSPITDERGDERLDAFVSSPVCTHGRSFVKLSLSINTDAMHDDRTYGKQTSELQWHAESQRVAHGSRCTVPPMLKQNLQALHRF